MADKVKNKNTTADSSAGGILVRLWNLIIYDGNLHKLLRFYLDKYANRGGKRSKSTIHGYFTAEKMTWKTFLFLIFEILPVKKMRITIELTMVNNDIIPHTVSITSDEFFASDEDEVDIFNKVYVKKSKTKENIKNDTKFK